MFDLKPVQVPDLTGRTALVTGAGRGIGAALVRQLTQADARVYAGLRHPPDPATEHCLDGAIRLPLDVTDPDTVSAVADRIAEEAGQLDALFNNAGRIAPIGPLASLSAEDLVPAFNVNAIGMYRMTMGVLDLLRNSGGVVVNAGTGAATTPMEGWTAYCASKAAMRMLTQMMEKELAATGIRVFFLGIPPTDTDMQAEIRASGMNRVSRIPKADLVPTEVPASVMAWLCSDQARSLTSAILDVRDDLFRTLPERSAKDASPRS